jgi:hypothetical protein
MENIIYNDIVKFVKPFKETMKMLVDWTLVPSISGHWLFFYCIPGIPTCMNSKTTHWSARSSSFWNYKNCSQVSNKENVSPPRYLCGRGGCCWDIYIVWICKNGSSGQSSASHLDLSSTSSVKGWYIFLCFFFSRLEF